MKEKENFKSGKALGAMLLLQFLLAIGILIVTSALIKPLLCLASPESRPKANHMCEPLLEREGQWG